MSDTEAVYAKVARGGVVDHMNTRAEQVVLRLLPGGRFTLLDASYTDDTWGERSESSVKWSGTWEEIGGEVVCRATSKRSLEKTIDRDWGRKDKKTSTTEVDEVFTFRRLGPTELACPLERFEGEALSSDQEPHRGVF